MDETPGKEEDFQINNFSPNDEGPAAPLHIFEHHGIKRKLPLSEIEQVDEAMTEDDFDSNTP